MKRIFNVYVNGELDTVVKVTQDLFDFGTYKFRDSIYTINGLVYAESLIEATENIFLAITKRILTYLNNVEIKSFEIKEVSENEND